jgi:glutathione S-transferase
MQLPEYSVGLGIASIVAISFLYYGTRQKKSPKFLTTKQSNNVIVCAQHQERAFPAGSPSVCKLLAFLKAHGVEHSLLFVKSFGDSPNKKVPFVHYKGEILADSHFIIQRLIKDGTVPDPDSWLNKEQRATTTLVRNSIESALYWGIVKERWIDQWETLRKIYFAALPWFLFFLPNLLRKTVAKSLYTVGTTRYTPEQHDQIMVELFQALETQMSDGKYFHGNRISYIDFCLFGQLANIVYMQDVHPHLYSLLEGYPKLIRHTERMKAHCEY